MINPNKKVLIIVENNRILNRNLGVEDRYKIKSKDTGLILINRSNKNIIIELNKSVNIGTCVIIYNKSYNTIEIDTSSDIDESCTIISKKKDSENYKILSSDMSIKVIKSKEREWLIEGK